MATDVDVCNIALSYLGDSAVIGSINPPSGGAQAQHCARFFPLALGEFVEAHEWNWCTTRVSLAEVDNPTTTWIYAYGLPGDMASPIAVISSDAGDDYSVGIPSPYTTSLVNFDASLGGYTAQPYSIETLADGTPVLLTNQQYAVLRYKRIVENVGPLPPLAIEALARLLAAKLAGPIIRGEKGRAEARDQMTMYARVALPAARASDSKRQRIGITHTPDWVANR